MQKWKVAAMLIGILCLAPRASADPATDDWIARSTAPGVTTAEGFDEASRFVQVQSGEGLYAGDSGLMGSQDTSIKASGTSSLKFTVPSQGAADAAGCYMKYFGQEFGQNSHYYIQWQQRFDPNLLANQYQASGSGPGSTSWKQIIVWSGYGSNCAQTQWVILCDACQGYPQGYSQCGIGWFTTLDRSSWTVSVL